MRLSDLQKREVCVMKIEDLTENEYLELCQNYISRFWSDSENGTTSPSADDLAVADELVDRQVIEDYYAGVEFEKEDFFCNL